MRIRSANGNGVCVLPIHHRCQHQQSFQSHQITLSDQNRDPTELVRSCERRDCLKVLNLALRKQSHLLVYVRDRTLKLTMDYKMTKLNICLT